MQKKIKIEKERLEEGKCSEEEELEMIKEK